MYIQRERESNIVYIVSDKILVIAEDKEQFYLVVDIFVESVSLFDVESMLESI